MNYITAPGSATDVMASVFIGGGINEDGEFATLADNGFPQDLTFLTDAVRPAIKRDSTRRAMTAPRLSGSSREQWWSSTPHRRPETLMAPVLCRSV